MSKNNLSDRWNLAEWIGKRFTSSEKERLLDSLSRQLLKSGQAIESKGTLGEHYELGDIQEQLRTILLRFEQDQRFRDINSLLHLVPAHVIQEDPELQRIQYRAQLWEFRRIRNNRRWLYTYLFLQVLLIVIVFPFLFQNAENGAIQRQIEQTSGVELGDEGYRLLSYTRALYWSVITATSIGYGDVTPMTDTGRIIAATLGTMGVITIGVIAGLILRWITPEGPY